MAGAKLCLMCPLLEAHFVTSGRSREQLYQSWDTGTGCHKGAQTSAGIGIKLKGNYGGLPANPLETHVRGVQLNMAH